MFRLRKSPGSPFPTDLVRYLVLPMGALVLGLAAIVAGLLWVAANSQDRIAQAGAEATARGALGVAAQHLEDSVRDYAARESTLLLEAMPPGDGSIAPCFSKDGGFSTILATNVGGRAVFGAVEGRRLPADQVRKGFGLGLIPLLDAAHPGGPARSAFVMFAGVPHLAAAAAVKAATDGDARGVLVFTIAYDEPALAVLGRRFSLEGLRFAAAGKPEGEASVPLVDAAGQPIGALAWRVEAPGMALLHDLGLPLAGIFMIALGLGGLIVMRVRTAAAAFEASHRQLAAQAEALAAARDAAEAQRRTEAELRRKAIAASQAKSEFLAHMSHEFRTPLNAIIGFSEFVLMTPATARSEAKILEYVGDIHQSGRHLLALINDVLDLAKIEAGKRDLEEEDLALDGCIDDCLRLMQPQIGDKELAVVHDRSGLTMRADARAMQQILINLLSNAIKFTGRGGRIAVKTERRARQVVVTVSDSGCGIRQEDLSRVLEPFQQAEAPSSHGSVGSGLGLTITRHLVEMHGGSLKLESAIGVGTRASVILPASRLVPDAQPSFDFSANGTWGLPEPRLL